MAFKEKQDIESDVTISLGGFNKKTKTENPTKIQGYFLGSKTVKSAKSTSGFAQIHTFQTVDGNVAVWGKTDLDKKLADPTIVGTMVRITCTGLIETKGGNQMYKFKVEVDEDNRIDSSEDGDDGYTDEEEEEVADEVAPTRATAPRSTTPAPTASKQAATKALLAKGRTAQQ